jgi:isopenicillin N synthase-like dioxygenase
MIDIEGLCEGDARATQRVAEALREPCATWGAFQIVGHGIPRPELERFEAAMHSLFELSKHTKDSLRRTRDNARGYYDEELTKNRRDWKEVFDYGAERSPSDTDAEHSDGTNQWPAAPLEPREQQHLRDTLMNHYAACERVALALLRALCASLGVDADSLDAHFARHSSFVRLNRYAPCPDPAGRDAPLFPESGHLGVHHHTDAGALTLVHQDAVGGLQILHDDRFVIVEPVAGAFAVNLGDMLQVWSNDRYRSPVHRALVNSDEARYSAPFFLNPSYETICQPLPNILGRGERARFRPVSWAHFRDQRSAGDYADYGAEIQIEDFRIG